MNPNDRIAIFIDGENIHYSAKHMNMRLDYLKLCEKLAGPRRLVRSYFYTAISSQSEGKIDFINFLKLNGFKVVTKEIKSFNESEATNRSLRSSLDMEMAIDVLELAPSLDTVILCTGDGDFRPLVAAPCRPWQRDMRPRQASMKLKRRCRSWWRLTGGADVRQ